MVNQNEMLVDPKIKKEINEQGFEGDAAVLIGKEEEMAQMEQRLEKEGRAENLGTYIKMHKEIVLPNDKIDLDIPDIKLTYLQNLKKDLLQNKGLVWYGDERGDEGKDIFYIDKDGNVVKVIIDPAKISSLKDAFIKEERIAGFSNKYDRRKLYELISQEFKDLGLNEVYQTQDLPLLINNTIRGYNKKIESDLENKKKQGFDL